MKTLILASALTLSALPVLAQDNSGIVYGTIEYGVLETDNLDTYNIPLAPGEQVIGIYKAPSVIQVPQGNSALYATPYAPPADIDRVTGLPRNTPGWTGDAAKPAGIGCFPQGACAHLN